MARKSGLVVLDFDDTLFFTLGSLNKAVEELIGDKPLSKNRIRKFPKPLKRKIYELGFSKYRDYSKPNKMLVDRLDRLRKSNKIIVLTARGKTTHKDTLYLIKTHSIKVDGLYSREDVAGKDEIWKLGRLKRYSKIYKKVQLYEDKMENIDYIRKNVGSKNIDYYLVSKTNIKKV